MVQSKRKPGSVTKSFSLFFSLDIIFTKPVTALQTTKKGKLKKRLLFYSDNTRQ